MRKIPKTLGACADRLYDLKEQKAKIQKQLNDLDDEYRALKDHIINELPVSDAQGVMGKRATVKIVTRQVPTAKDWDAVYKYIKRTGSWDLLQKRLSTPAWKARLEDGKKIPGVEPFTVKDASLTKNR